MIESRCGLLCSDCSFREAMGCKGCVYMEKLFWADSCPVKSCCEQKGLRHCGECGDFVCPLLHTFAYDMEQSDNGARIEQCRKWCTVRTMRDRGKQMDHHVYPRPHDQQTVSLH